MSYLLRPHSRIWRLSVSALLCCAAASALAQYKVVAPDGRVTYTDRPQPEAGAKVSSLKRSAATLATSAPGTPLPFELRSVAARFPVTLYTSTDCAPCDSARRLLQQRGIPYSERTIAGDDDVLALERLSGGRTLPALAVGRQYQRGLLDAEWQALLDLAGYPRQSILPPAWQPPPATPLVARMPAPELPARTAPSEPLASAEPATPTEPPTGPAIRF